MDSVSKYLDHSRLHQPTFYTDPAFPGIKIPTTISWFDLSDGVFISLGFLMPAVVIALHVWLGWLQSRYWVQVNALDSLLRTRNPDLTPPITPNWQASPSELLPTAIKGVNPLDWQSGHSSRIWHLFVDIAVLAVFCATALVSLTHSYATGNQLIDIITPIIAAVIITLFLIFWIRAIMQFSSNVHVDELGLTPPTSARSQPSIVWSDIRAFYIVESNYNYWLFLTDKQIFGWYVSPKTSHREGTQLARIVAEKARVPVYDATKLCKIALSSDTLKVPDTAEFALYTRWEEALATAKVSDTRRPPNFVPAFIVAGIGLVFGIAATYIIAQLATAWVTRM